MDATLLTQWVSNRQINAICWTLVHSLWIGVIVAALAGLVVVSTQKSSAQLRYQLLCSCLVLFVLLMGFVYYQEATSHHSSDTITNPVGSTTTIADPTVETGSGIVKQNDQLVDQLIATINNNSEWIFAAWLLFFVLKSLKLISGLVYIHRIRSHRVYAPSEEWQQKVLAFSQRLGIRQSITVLQSQLVKVPVTVGILKPVILLPVGLIFQLPVEQIDTILWHELAHVWRRDYLMNLLQSLIETIFFFNPALLWISALIREERETCCDDIVLAQTTSKSNYLEALLAFQEHAYQPVSYAMPLGFRSQQLVDRLKRIVTQENKRLSVVEKIVLLSGLILLSASAFVSKGKPEIHTVIPSLKSNALTVVRDESKTASVRQPYKESPIQTLPLPKRTQAATVRTPQAKHVVVIDSSLKFTSIVFVKTNQDMANREMIVRDNRGNDYHLKIANSQLVALEVNKVAISSTDLPQYYGLLRQIDQALTEKRQQKQEMIAEATARMKAERAQQFQYEKEARQNKASHVQQLTNLEKPQKDLADPTSKQKLFPVEKDKTAWLNDKKKQGTGDTTAKRQSWGKKIMPSPPDISYDQERVRGVIATLVAEKIVSDPASVDWFGLSNDELIVNGQKQPEALHQRLKTQYGIKPQYGLYYGPVKMTGTGIFLDKEDLSR